MATASRIRPGRRCHAGGSRPRHPTGRTARGRTERSSDSTAPCRRSGPTGRCSPATPNAPPPWHHTRLLQPPTTPQRPRGPPTHQPPVTNLTAGYRCDGRPALITSRPLVGQREPPSPRRGDSVARTSWSGRGFVFAVPCFCVVGCAVVVAGGGPLAVRLVCLCHVAFRRCVGRVGVRRAAHSTAQRGAGWTRARQAQVELRGTKRATVMNSSSEGRRGSERRDVRRGLPAWSGLNPATMGVTVRCG
jgi:hypothetical protein